MRHLGNKHKTPGALTQVGIALIVTAILAIALSHYYPIFLAERLTKQGLNSRTINLQKYSIEKVGGYYAVDLTDLGVVTLADTERASKNSPLILLEKGKPLAQHASMSDLRNGKRGVFRHARPKVASMEDAYNYSVNHKDMLFFVPYDESSRPKHFSLIVPASSADAYVLSRSPQHRLIVNTIWVISMIVTLIGCVLIEFTLKDVSYIWYKIPLVVAMGAVFYVMTAHSIIQQQWAKPPGAFTYYNSFITVPDSASYYFPWSTSSTRLPGYHWFIKITAGNYDPDQIFGSTPVGEFIDDEDHPLLRVTQAQILVLIGASLVLMSVMMWYFHSPLPVPFFLFLYKLDFLIKNVLNMVLTEPLMQACVLLGVSLCLAVYSRKSLWPLYAAALCLGYAYLVRPSGVFASLVLGSAMLYLLFVSWRQYWKHVVAVFTLYMLVFFGANFSGAIQEGKFFSESSSYQYKIVKALILAKSEDVNLLPTPKMREWFSDALIRRAAADAKYDASTAGNIYNNLVYRTQAAYEAALTKNPTSHDPTFYADIAKRIFTKRWIDYIGYSLNFARITLFGSYVDRINFGPIKSWGIYLCIALLIGSLRTRIAFFAGFLVLSHWVHVLIMCMFAAPIGRMVWSSDIMVFLGLFILVLEAAGTVKKRFMGLQPNKNFA